MTPSRAPKRRCLQYVHVPTGGTGLSEKLLSVCAGLDVVDVGAAKSVSGTRFAQVLLAGNDRDLHLAGDRVLKLGGKLA